MPHNYSFEEVLVRSLSSFKLSLILCIAILNVIDAVKHLIVLTRKTRSLWKHRVNEFESRDFLVVLQQLLYLTLFIYGCILFVD